MKRLFFYFIFALCASSLFVSCNSKELQPTEIIVQDDMLSPAAVQRIKNLDIPDGYLFLIKKIEDVDKGKISKYAKKQYRQLQKDGTAGGNAILILYIENCKMLVTRMPDNLRNYIDIEYPSEYFNAQIVRDREKLDASVESMLEIIRKSVAEYEQLSRWRKNVVSENIFALTDALFNPVLPSDSWVFKLFFYIPLTIDLCLFGITKSLIGAALVLLFVSVLWRIMFHKITSMPLFGCLALLFWIYVILLPMWSLYILALPRYEHIYLLHAFGYNSDFVAALQSFYANYTYVSAHWLAIVLFCVVLVALKLVSKPDYVLYGIFLSPSLQRKIYEKEKRDVKLNQMQDILNDEYTPTDLDSDSSPYSSLIGGEIGKAFGRLFYLIPLGLMLNTNILYVITLICLPFVFNKIFGIVEGYISLKKSGVEMHFFNIV